MNPYLYVGILIVVWVGACAVAYSAGYHAAIEFAVTELAKVDLEENLRAKIRPLDDQPNPLAGTVTLTQAERARMDATHRGVAMATDAHGQPVSVCSGCGMPAPCPGLRLLESARERHQGDVTLLSST